MNQDSLMNETFKFISTNYYVLQFKNILQFIFFLLSLRSDSDDFGKSAQISYWFKESFLEIELDIKEGLEEEKLLMLYFHQEECTYCKATIEKNFFRSNN